MFLSKLGRKFAPDAKASFGQSAGERDLTGLERVKEAVDDDGEVAGSVEKRYRRTSLAVATAEG